MGAMYNGMMDEWVREVVPVYADKVDADPRFPDGKLLISAFDKAASLWMQRRSKDDIKAVTERCNELAAAAGLLDRLLEGHTLAYEPKLANTKKTLDFRVDGPVKPLLWVDVKTVAPEWVDTDAEWERFNALREELPANMHLVVNNGGIGVQMLKTRWSIYQRTREIENKLALMTEEERATPASALFCSSGFDWHDDTLEDFADYYIGGAFRQDDWSATMMTRYVAEKDIRFDRSLVAFHYLERKQFVTLAQEFRLGVRGPAFLR